MNPPRNPDPTRKLTREQLARLSREIDALGIQGTQSVYRDVYGACRLDPGYLPDPEDIQRLVVAWKLLWKSRDGILMQTRGGQAV